MTKYKFTEHINVTTKVFAKKLAKKFGLDFEEVEELALWFIIASNVKDGKQEQFLEELFSYDLTSGEFEEFNAQLLEQDDFKALIENLERFAKKSEETLGKNQKNKTKK